VSLTVSIRRQRQLIELLLCFAECFFGVSYGRLLCFADAHWKGAREKIRMHFGRPDFYYKFVANIIANNCQDVIIPFAMDSIGAARVIKWLGLVPNLIYVDASHEQGDVVRDYEAYWDLLGPGGGMLVDDLTNYFPGVVADWNRFMGTYAVEPVLVEGEKALAIKK